MDEKVALSLPLTFKGQKMSKSIGNLVTPAQLIAGPAVPAGSKPKEKREVPKTLLDKSWPVDVLRMWVASADYTYDVSLGVSQMLKVQETYQKIRNTHRYLLSNLIDFSPADRVDYARLSLPDKWCLSRLSAVSSDVFTAYERFAFTDV